MEEKKDFESQLARLEKIVRELESGEVSLEKSVQLFRQGMEVGRDCQKRLEQARKEVSVFLDGSWQEFESENEQ